MKADAIPYKIQEYCMTEAGIQKQQDSKKRPQKTAESLQCEDTSANLRQFPIELASTDSDRGSPARLEAHTSRISQANPSGKASPKICRSGLLVAPREQRACKHTLSYLNHLACGLLLISIQGFTRLQKWRFWKPIGGCVC